MEIIHRKIYYKGIEVIASNDISFLGMSNMPQEKYVKLVTRNKTHWASMEIPILIIDDKEMMDTFCKEVTRLLFTQTLQSGKS